MWREKMVKLKISWKVWLLIIALVLSLISILGMPPAILEKGVIVKSIDDNSSAYQNGLRQGDIITSLNNVNINSMEDYSEEINKLFPSDKDVKIVLGTKRQQIIFFTNSIPDIAISDIPNTRIKTGLDLSGGARALVKPEKKLTDQEIDDLISVSSERFNV